MLGLTDVDALTLSMTRSVATGTTIEAACRAITMGIIANSIMKTVIAVTIGKGRFAWQTGERSSRWRRPARSRSC